jgi:hypothetical protein
MDPRSKIPEFKVSACRIEKSARTPMPAMRGGDGKLHLDTGGRT